MTWSVEWILASGEKMVRNCLETGILSEAYDRALPLPKEERPGQGTAKERQGDQKEDTSTNLDKSTVSTAPDATPTTDSSKEQHPAQAPASKTAEASAEKTKEESSERPISPHRDVYFYIHRPQTKTKKPVLAALPPSATLNSVLRGRTVLEFPTIYVLPNSTEELRAEQEDSQFILEADYLQTADPEEIGGNLIEPEVDGTGAEGSAASDLQDLDEKKVLEVLKQDLFEPVPEGEVS